MVCFHCGKKVRFSKEDRCWIHQTTKRTRCAKSEKVARPVTQKQYDRRPATEAELASLMELTTRGARC